MLTAPAQARCLRALVLASLVLVAAPGTACPQDRATESAPDSYQDLSNPLPASAQHISAGQALYDEARASGACASCHGADGDGRGPAGAALDPPARDFTCAPTMEALSDGQLFWVIAHGSGDFHVPARQAAQQLTRPGRRAPFTAMTPYRQQLSDAEIWQLVHYIRAFTARAGDEQ